MNTIRFNSKDSFAAALEERRPFWRDYDKRQEVAHRAEEKVYLTRAREALRRAIKMDYATLKERHNYSVTIGTPPKCPVLMEAKIDAVLAALKFTQGKAFTVDSNGAWDQAHSLLTWNPDAPKTVC